MTQNTRKINLIFVRESPSFPVASIAPVVIFKNKFFSISSVSDYMKSIGTVVEIVFKYLCLPICPENQGFEIMSVK